MNLDLSLFERFARTIATDEVIFFEYEPGDSFYFIQSGRVRISKIIGSIEKTIDILKPGEFFGEMALLENAPRSATSVAIEECKLLEFNRNNFRMLMSGNPQMALKLLKLFAKRIHDQKRRFAILTIQDDHVKVADVFVMLSEHMNETNENEENASRKFNNSVSDIAHWAGLSPEYCRDILIHLQDQRKVSVFKDHILVTNIHDLSRMVSSRRNTHKEQE